MKKAISSFLSILLLTAIGYSQTNEKLEKRVENLRQKLSLTEDQASKVRVILKNTAAEIKKEKTAAKEKAKREIQSANEQIELLLTDDQKAKYKALKEEKKAEMKEKRKGRKKE